MNIQKVKFTNPYYYQIDPSDSTNLIVNPEFSERLHGPKIKIGFLKDFDFEFGEVCVKSDNGLVTYFNPCSDPNFEFIRNKEAEHKSEIDSEEFKKFALSKSLSNLTNETSN